MRSLSTSTCFGAAAMLFGLTAGGCGGGAAETLPASNVPAPSYNVASPEEWATLEAAGKTAYDRACGACHPGGAADLGPKVTGLGWDTHHMYQQIREGSGRMKPISEDRLPESEMKALFVYLASIGAVSDIQQP